MIGRVYKRAVLFVVLISIAGAFAHAPGAVRAGFPTNLAPPPLPVLRLSRESPEAVRPSQQGKGSADLVVLVSIDGLRPDVITPSTRALHRLYLQGASPRFARTIDKSATLPSHASMVSGVEPEDHGLNFNAYRPKRGNIHTPTIFSEVHLAGLPSVMYVGKGKLTHLLASPTQAEFHVSGVFCRKVIKQALPELQKATRGVFFLHFADPDGAGHRYGWMTDEYLAAVRNTDHCLERVLDTIDAAGRTDRTLLLVTSDHGGHNRSHGTRLDVDQQIPWFAWGAGVKRGRIHRAVHTTDTAATTLAALGLRRPEMHGIPIPEALVGVTGPDGMPLFGSPIERRNADAL